MNRYGTLARAHWAKHLPDRLRSLETPETFFQTLGEQVEQRVEELTEARKPQSSNDYLQNLQNLNSVQREAEAEAMKELVLLQAEESP